MKYSQQRGYSLSLNQCYQELNILQTNNFSVVKNAYYELSKKHHPDMNSELSEEQQLQQLNKFKRINLAFQTIKDDLEKKGFNVHSQNKENENQFNQECNSPFFNNAEYYQTISKEQLYKKIFGKSQEEDPMAYYKADNQKLREQYQQQLNIWEMYQAMQENNGKRSQCQDQNNYYQEGFSQQKKSDYYEPPASPQEKKLVAYACSGLLEWREKFKKKQEKLIYKKEIQKIDHFSKKYEEFLSSQQEREKIKQMQNPFQSLPKEFQDSFPKKHSYDYHKKCSNIYYKNKQVAMIIYYLGVQENPETKALIRKKFQICPGYE